mmetsp:Transcript_69055/g.152435  ORF Transcript_69055/g.152435 Transcript_69055/m.152435 type:complete len:266 (-) Transcript_69055:2600-3397(-)
MTSQLCENSNWLKTHGLKELLVVDCLKGHRSILTSHIKDGLRATWVLPHILRHIVDLPVQGHPQIPVCAVFQQFLLGDLAQFLRSWRRNGRNGARSSARSSASCADGQSHSHVATEDCAFQQRVASQSVVPMNTATGLANSVEARDGFLVFVQHLTFYVDGNPSHSVVDHRHHLTDVEILRLFNGVVGKNGSPKDVATAFRCIVVISKALLQNVHLIAEVLSEAFHTLNLRQEPLLGVQGHMALGHLGSLAVQHQSKGPMWRRLR